MKYENFIVYPTRSLTLRVLADAVAEDEEQFTVNITPTSGVVGIVNASRTVTIRETRMVAVRRAGDQSIVTLRTAHLQRYALEASPNLVSWSGVSGAEDIVGTGGDVDVAVPAEVCCGQEFYRARLLP